MSPPMGLGLGLALSFGVAGPSGPPYTPTAAPGLVWWTHADSLSASPVASWSYGAGNVVNGGATKPTWSAASANVGGAASVLYSGTQLLTAPSTSALQLTGDFTISSVVYYTSAVLNIVISKMNAAATSGEFDIAISGAANVAAINQWLSGSLVSVSSTAVFAAGAAFVITIIKSGTTVSFRKNRVAAGSGTIGAGVTATANAVVIGRRADNGVNLTGEQPEIVMCNQALAGTDLTNLEGYLRAKYGTP